MTCASSIKLAHAQTKTRLHSHEIAYAPPTPRPPRPSQPPTTPRPAPLPSHPHEHQPPARGRSYGSGSGQQSVTGYPDGDDSNSLWVVSGQIGPDGQVQRCERGSKVRNGQVLRLKHSSTGHWLHSHRHASPLSNNQEARAAAGQRGSRGPAGVRLSVCPSVRLSAAERRSVRGSAVRRCPPSAA